MTNYFSQIASRLQDGNGNLTPLGQRVLQVFNVFVNFGHLPQESAAALLGGFLREDPNLNPLQIEGQSTAFVGDAPVAGLIAELQDQSLRAYRNDKGEIVSGKGISLPQWTTTGRKAFVAEDLRSLDPSSSAVEGAARAVIEELSSPPWKDVLDALRHANNLTAAQEIAYGQYESPRSYQNELKPGRRSTMLILDSGLLTLRLSLT